jgi:hypothetical protein
MPILVSLRNLIPGGKRTHRSGIKDQKIEDKNGIAELKRRPLGPHKTVPTANTILPPLVKQKEFCPEFVTACPVGIGDRSRGNSKSKVKTFVFHSNGMRVVP